MKETDLLRYTLALLAAHKILAWRVPMGGVAHQRRPGGEVIMKRNPMTGFPDICGVTSTGRLVAIECKLPKGRFSTAQKEWALLLKTNNALYFVVRSTDDALHVVSHIKKLIQLDLEKRL